MILNEIKKQFLKTGIKEFGITSAADAAEVILDGNSPFHYKGKILSIHDILPNAKSIIVYLLPYNHGLIPENLSLYATGKDYHKICHDIANQISSLLNTHGFQSVCFADSGPLNERKLASLAGLGVIGDNGFLINSRYGSYTFIGYIITTCPITPSSSSQGECMHCGKCISSCPTKALGNSNFCESMCISYLTQKKGILSDQETALIKRGKSAWGCDICQLVCPMNKDKELTEIKEFKENLILCIKNEYLSNREFKTKYVDRAFLWRGKQVIERNLSILNDKND